MKLHTIHITIAPKLDLKPYHPMYGKPMKQQFIVCGFDESGEKMFGSVTSNPEQEVIKWLSDLEDEEEDNGKCPECGAPIVVKWSGVKCSKCE